VLSDTIGWNHGESRSAHADFGCAVALEPEARSSRARHRGGQIALLSGPIPKFASSVRHLRLRTSESRTTSNSMILVPLLNPKFAIAFAARCARTSGSGH
jgi:hypothetical protein